MEFILKKTGSCRNIILLNMKSFPDIYKQYVKSQTISKIFYKKNVSLAVSNLFRSFILGKLERGVKFA